MMKAFLSSIRFAIKAEEAKKELMYSVYHTEVKEVQGVEVHHSNLTMSAHCAIAAAAFRHPVTGFAIYVEDRFFTLPKDVQMFLLAHEKGHDVHDHIEDSQARIKEAKKKRVYINEFEADSYAAEQIGFDKAVSALFYLAEYITRCYGKGIISREMNLRAQALITNK